MIRKTEKLKLREDSKKSTENKLLILNLKIMVRGFMLKFRIRYGNKVFPQNQNRNHPILNRPGTDMGYGFAEKSLRGNMAEKSGLKVKLAKELLLNFGFL